MLKPIEIEYPVYATRIRVLYAIICFFNRKRAPISLFLSLSFAPIHMMDDEEMLCMVVRRGVVVELHCSMQYKTRSIFYTYVQWYANAMLRRQQFC